MSKDTIYRHDAIVAVNDYLRLSQVSRTIQAMTSIQEILEKLPPAQPELDEWCYDCKEYDKEKHSCPRWNRVIRNALKDAQKENIYCKNCVNAEERGCALFCGFWTRYTAHKGYCFKAERREE